MVCTSSTFQLTLALKCGRHQLGVSIRESTITLVTEILLKRTIPRHSGRATNPNEWKSSHVYIYKYIYMPKPYACRMNSDSEKYLSIFYYGCASVVLSMHGYAMCIHVISDDTCMY